MDVGIDLYIRTVERSIMRVYEEHRRLQKGHLYDVAKACKNNYAAILELDASELNTYNLSDLELGVRLQGDEHMIKLDARRFSFVSDAVESALEAVCNDNESRLTIHNIMDYSEHLPLNNQLYKVSYKAIASIIYRYANFTIK